MFGVFLAMAVAANIITNPAEVSSYRTTAIINSSTLVIDFIWSFKIPNARGFTAVSGTCKEKEILFRLDRDHIMKLN